MPILKFFLYSIICWYSGTCYLSSKRLYPLWHATYSIGRVKKKLEKNCEYERIGLWISPTNLETQVHFPMSCITEHFAGKGIILAYLWVKAPPGSNRPAIGSNIIHKIYMFGCNWNRKFKDLWQSHKRLHHYHLLNYLHQCYRFPVRI